MINLPFDSSIVKQPNIALPISYNYSAGLTLAVNYANGLISTAGKPPSASGTTVATLALGAKGISMRPTITTGGTSWPVRAGTWPQPMSVFFYCTLADVNTLSRGLVGLGNSYGDFSAYFAVRRVNTNLTFYDGYFGETTVDSGNMLQYSTHAIGVTFDGVTLKVFRNGKLVYSASRALYPLGNKNSLFIGNSYGTSPIGTDYYLAAYWATTYVSDSLMINLTTNPWSLFSNTAKPIFVTSAPPPAVTAYYPGSDISVTGWTASTGTSLWATIDELTEDDSDYDKSDNTYGPATFGLTTPLPVGTWTIVFAGKKVGPSKQIRILLKDSSSTLATGAWHTQTDSYAQYSDIMTVASPADRFTIEVQ